MKRALPFLLGLALLFALSGEAHAAKLCCGFFPPESQVSEGTQGEQFTGIAGVAVNSQGFGPGAEPGDIYVVDRGNDRIQQFREIADGEGHRFVRAFGLDVGGAGVNVCTVAASCQAGTASAAAGGMSEPKGIAVDQATGNLYVSDDGNHRIDVFGADGTFQGAFGWKVDATTPLEELQLCTTATGCQAGSTGGGAGQFGLPGGNAAPRGIGYPAVSPSGAPNAGNLIVADTANNRIAEFEPTLNLGGEVTGIAFKRGIGWSVTATTPLEKMQECTTASGCQTGSAGGALGQFTNFGLTRVAVDATGAMYAVNLPSAFLGCDNGVRHCHVQKVDFAATTAVEFAPAQLNHTSESPGRVAATDIAVDPSIGEVFVVTPNGKGATAEYELLHFDLSGNLFPDRQGVKIDEQKVFGLALSTDSGRIYFTSSDGGQRVYLLTDPPPIAPGVTSGETSAGANFALRTLEGEVNPEGFRVLGCRFEYGPTTAYGTTTPCIPGPVGIGEGTGEVEVEAEAEPLEPNTTYHYRLVAENGGPVGKGEDRTFTTGPAPKDSCPNAKRRAEQGIVALLLPDCMALEMVSPPKKSGQPAKGPNVSADGSRVSFISAAVLGGGPGILGLGGNVYVATREASEWGVESTIPGGAIVKLWESENAPSFAPDFSRWLQIGATYDQLQLGIGQAFDAGLGGQLDPLSDSLVPQTSIDRNVVRNASFQGASADHTHLYFQPGPPSAPASYLPGDPQLSGPGPGAETANTYLVHTEVGAPQPLELLERDRDGKVWGGNCGARLGGFGPVVAGSPARNGERNQGAISADGTRTYLSARAAQPASGPCSEASKLRILERLETPTGPTIAPLFTSECTRVSPACDTADGDDLYQGASADGTKTYLTTNRQLANSDLDGTGEECNTEKAVAGCDLYLFDRSRPAGERLIQVSAGKELGPGVHEAGKEAKAFNGVTAISGDGSRVYFVAQGVLTDEANPSGASAQANKPNLYLWDEESGATSFLGTLDPADAIKNNVRGIGLWGGQGTWRNNAYPVPVSGPGSGQTLLFLSKAQLTSADADGKRLDAYRYDASGLTPTLACISCRPGGPDGEQFDVDNQSQSRPGGTDFAEEGRWVSEDGQSVGFLTPEGLVPGDVNEANDFYLWRGGELVRVPGKPFTTGSSDGPFLSHDGSVAAFTTSSALLPQDGDTVADVYVARVGGGYPNPAVSTPCTVGSCQASEAPPAAPNPASSTFNGPGNVTPKPQPCPPKKRKVRRKGKVRCVPKHPRKSASKEHKRARHANADRRSPK